MVHLVVSIINLAGRVLALWKVILLAAVFGASQVLDAFYIAYAIPFILPEVLKSIISTAFIPRFVKHIDPSTGICSDWRGANTIFTLYFIGVLFASILFYLFSQSIIRGIALGADQVVIDQAVSLFKVLNVIMPLLGINGILTTMSHCFGRFFIVSTETFILNAVIIISILLFGKDYGIYAVIYGIVVGFILFTMMLITVNWNMIRNFVRFSFQFKHKDVVGSFGQMLPLLVGQVGAVAIGIVDLEFASFLSAGAISAMNYAIMLALLPLEVFGNAIITTHYPKLSKSIISSKLEEMRAVYQAGVTSILFYVVPICVVLIFFSEDVVRIVFMRGEFDQEALLLTSSALKFFAISIIVRAVAYYNYRVLHAANMSWSQISLGLFGMVTNIAGNFLLVGPLGLAGIALATAIAMTQNLVVSTLIIHFKVDKKLFPILLVSIARMLPAVISFILVSLVIYNSVSDTIMNIFGPFWGALTLMTVSIAPAGLIFMLITWQMKFEDSRIILSNIFKLALKLKKP